MPGKRTLFASINAPRKARSHAQSPRLIRICILALSRYTSATKTVEDGQRDILRTLRTKQTKVGCLRLIGSLELPQDLSMANCTVATTQLTT